MRYFEFEGHRIAYLAHGTEEEKPGIPLFFIHGLTASVRFWEAAMPAFVRAGHRWYSISLPLHHPSRYAGEKAIEASLTEESFARMLRALIDHLEPSGPVGVLGYSVGGFAVLNLAAKYPARIATVVSIGGFTQGRAKGIEGTLRFFARGRFLRPAIFWLGFKTMQLHPWFLRRAVFFYAHDKRALRNYSGLGPTIRSIWPDVKRHRVNYIRAWFGLLLRKNLMDEIHRIKCPVLVFAGDQDPIIPFAHQVNYAEKLTNARLVVLAGVGHVPFGEAEATFERELADWLQEQAQPEGKRSMLQE